MVIAGTGHRPDKLGGYSDEAFNKLVNLVENWLLDYGSGSSYITTRIISGMALGWDQALAKAAINLNIPFDAYCPCKNQDIKWPKKSRDAYQDILKEANNIFYISEGYTNTCMQERNIRMVDNCDILLALWNGTSGGTANCIKYAETKSDKIIINLWNDYIKIK